MIYTNHPDEGQPMTIERLRRCYLVCQTPGTPTVVRLTPLKGSDDNNWQWSFATFRLRVELALEALLLPDCNCGFGGFHDDINPRCDRNRIPT